MLDFDASAIAVRREFDFDFGLRLPFGSFPGERDDVRRLKSGNAADFEFGAVGKSLEESAADAAFDKNVLGLFTAEREPFFQRPPFADFLR